MKLPGSGQLVPMLVGTPRPSRNFREDHPAQPQHLLVQIRWLLLWLALQGHSHSEAVAGAHYGSRTLDGVEQAL